MSLRVVGAGFGRTGTLSLKRALEELGFGPTYHMQEVMRRPSHVAKWLRYARTGEVVWEELFSDFASGVDFPVSCVWDRLAAHYPDAKGHTHRPRSADVVGQHCIHDLPNALDVPAVGDASRADNEALG
jgi:hypothetical protein